MSALQPRVSFYTKYGKRLCDVALAAYSAAPAHSRHVGDCGVGMAHEGNIIFRHRRVGRGGKEFTCYKFRTMVLDADERLTELLASDSDAKAEWDLNYKLKYDPRVTRLGRLLRRSSLDELPQIWNIICGDMSFVGPRPITHAELPKYDNYINELLSIRPGITGQWQINARGEASYEVRIMHDIHYLRNINFAKDLMLILKTAIVPLKFNGV